MNNNQIKENVKMKIAISNLKEEGKQAMNKKSKFILKNVSIAAGFILSFTGIAFAVSPVGSEMIKNIWSTPQKIENPTDKITEESKSVNISEEQAKEIAIQKLQNAGFNTNIINTNHYKEIEDDTIIYRFDTEDNFEISINGKTSQMDSIWNNNKNIQDRKISITEEEAKKAADNYCKLFGINKEDYEIKEIWSNNTDGSGKGSGFKIDITYYKKYNDVFNPFESIWISIESKNKNLESLSIKNHPFDNNEIKITQEEAISIALDEDKKINNNEKIIDTKAKKMIVQMNADAYKRINNKDEYYNSIQSTYSGERPFYKVNDKIRNAWVVVLTYDTYDNTNVVSERYTEGKYSYFVDCTTGEIIGGHVLDYTVMPY